VKLIRRVSHRRPPAPSGERPRESSRRIRLANLNAYKLTADARGTAGWHARVTTIQEIAPDILTLQEVVVDASSTPPEQWDTVAAGIINDFAEACGLTASVGVTLGHPHGTAMASNSHRPWYTAVLWNPNTVELVSGSYRPFGAPDFWHGCTSLVFNVGGSHILVATYHGHPFSLLVRFLEALRLKGVFRRSGGVKAGFLVGDFNGLSAAWRKRKWWQFPRRYDAEPYLNQRHDDLEFQVSPGRIGKRFRRQTADRRQTEALLRDGYMVDAAAHLEVPWHPTVGHWADGRGDPDPWGRRRIDLIFATRPVAPALTKYWVHTSPAAEAASDHLSPVVDFDPSKILPPSVPQRTRPGRGVIQRLRSALNALWWRGRSDARRQE
jgi:endonuclease/exonuclease/phosphatase family metal-dependent hydrolase